MTKNKQEEVCPNLLHELEILAVRWTNLGLHQMSEELRTVLAGHLRPGLKVRYYYASEWRIGVLLTRPGKDNPCWQIQRNGFGGWVDQVRPGPNTIRVYI
jgi:hypothetical protein